MKRFAIVVSMVCAGCFSALEGSSLPPEQDPPSDDPPPPPQEVQLTVHDAVGPLAGVSVIFMRSDDTVVSDVVTDAQGQASAQLPDGGSVTVVRPAPAASTTPPTSQPDQSPAQIYTYAGVKPGDHLSVSVSTPPTATPVTATVTLPVTEDVTAVAVMTPCGSAQGTPPSISVTLQGCGAETDFYVVDLGSNLSFLKRAPIAAAVDLSRETYADSLSSTFSVTNAPPGTSVAVESRLETDLFRPVYSSGMVPVADGTPATFDVPSLPMAEQHISIAIYGADGTEQVTMRQPYGQAPATVDVSPYVITSASAPTLAGDSVTWTEHGSGAPDLVLARLSSIGVSRQIVAAYTGASLRIPHLPAAYDQYNVQATDTSAISLAKVSDGYRGAVARVFAGPLAPLGGTATTTLADAPGTANGMDPTKP